MRQSSCTAGHPNPDGTDLCNVCGRPLEELAAVPEIAQIPPPPSEPSRFPEGSEWSRRDPADVVTTAQPLPPASPPRSLPPVTSTKRHGRVRLALAAGALIGIAAAAAGVQQWMAGEVAEADAERTVFAQTVDGEGMLLIGGLTQDRAELDEFASNVEFTPIRRLADPISAQTDPGPGILEVDGGTVVAWSDDGASVVAIVPSEGGAPRTLFEGPGRAIVLVSADRRRLLVELTSPDGRSMSCFSGPLDETPALITRAESCSFHPSGALLALGAEGRTAATATVFDSEAKPLRTVPAEGLLGLSPSGDRLLVSDGSSIALSDVADGAELGRIESDAVLGWADRADTLLSATTRGDEAQLSVMRSDGTTADLLAGHDVTGQLTADGEVVIGATRSGEEVQLYRIPTASTELQPLLTGDDLDFQVLPGPDPAIVVWSRNDGDVWYGSATSGELRNLGRIEGPQHVDQIVHDTDDAATFLVVDVAGEARLFSLADDLQEVPVRGETIAVEQIVDDRALVVSTADGESTLVEIGSDDAQQLARADELIAPRFHRSDVVYTTSEPDAQPPVISVRLADPSALTSTELQPGLALVARLGSGRLPWSVGRGSEDGPLWATTGPECEVGSDLLEGDATEGTIDAGGATFCVAVDQDGSRLQIELDSRPGVVLTITSEAGEVVATSDDAEGPAAQLDLVLDSGVYTVQLGVPELLGTRAYSLRARLTGP